MKYQTVLVTGGAGFIGSHLVHHLATQGINELRVLELEHVSVSQLPKGITVYRGDIRKRESLDPAFEGCDCVIHCAANPNLWASEPKEFERTNHQGTRNVIQAALSHHVQRFVHVSTDCTCLEFNGIPITQLKHWPGEYCYSKWLSEQAVLEVPEQQMETVILNPGVPLGPGDHHLGPISRLICDYYHGKVKGYMDGYITVMDVEDMAQGIWQAALSGKSKDQYLLAHESLTIAQFFHLLEKLSHKPCPQFKVPYWLGLMGAWCEERLARMCHRLPMATVTGIKISQGTLPEQKLADPSKLGLRPKETLVSLQAMTQWLDKQGYLNHSPLV